MSREAPVRFWEGLGVKFPGATQLMCKIHPLEGACPSYA